MSFSCVGFASFLTDLHVGLAQFAGEGHASDMEGFDEASSAYSLFLGDGNWHARTTGKQWCESGVD